ncbi:SHOCT domain-containing protein [Saccharothrix sp. 6-C]|uniref:SHOCT domain-containing protein n=1 Tax=Saccharothrix sp. 6-C TaxID=2781735 RepID=UPI001F40E1AA|nr:SHOCT domain-containing protein [Saccharothrix sp. 6-C]
MADELGKLQQLHGSGALSDAEFAAAKRRVLEQAPPPPAPPVMKSRDQSIGRAANRYVSFQVVAGVVGLIVFLILLFAFFIPTMSSVQDRIPPQPPGFHEPRITFP